MASLQVADPQLVARAKTGNHLAFVQLIEKYQQALYCTALSIVGSSWDAYDALQDTMLQAYLSLPNLKDNRTFKFWLTRILINKCHDLQRKQKRVIPVAQAGEQPYELTGHEENLDLLNALEKIDSKYRLVLSLRYFQDLQIKDIAALLKCSEATVKSRLSQGLQELKIILGSRNDGEVL